MCAHNYHSTDTQQLLWISFYYIKRAGLFAVRNVIEAISNDELIRIRNLGKKSMNEIRTRIM